MIMGWPQFLLLLVGAVLVFFVVRYALSLLRVAIGVTWQVAVFFISLAVLYFLVAAFVGVPEGWPTPVEIRQSIATILS